MNKLESFNVHMVKIDMKFDYTDLTVSKEYKKLMKLDFLLFKDEKNREIFKKQISLFL